MSGNIRVFVGLVHAALKHAYADYNEPLDYSTFARPRTETSTEPVA